MNLTASWLLEHFPDMPKAKIGECFRAVKTLPSNSTEEFVLAVCGQVIDGTWKPQKKKGFRVVPGSALEFLISIQFCPSITGINASNSEKKRMLEQKAVVINGKTPKPEEIIQFPIEELVFFPNGKNKTTLR